MNIQMIAFDQMIFCKVSTRQNILSFLTKNHIKQNIIYKSKILLNSFMILWLISKRHIILICIYMFNVDTQKSHIWTSVSCFLSELGSIPLLLFIPSTNSGNYLSFSHSMDFSLSNFRRTMKKISILFSINLEAIYNLMQMGGNYFSITAGDPL